MEWQIGLSIPVSDNREHVRVCKEKDKKNKVAEEIL